MINSLPYLLLFFCYLIIYLFEEITGNDEKSKKKIRFFCAVIFFFFFGFRGYVGSDWFNYELSYELTSWSEWLITDYEIGYSAIAKTFAHFEIEYFYFVAAVTALQVFLWNRFLGHYPHFSVSLSYIIIIALFPILIIDLQRNFISVLIVINALPYLEKGMNKKFYICVFLAMAFHLSAVVLLLLPRLQRVHFNKRSLSILFALGIIIYIFQINFYQDILGSIGTMIGGRFQHLIDQAVGEDEVSYGISIGIVEKILLMITMLAILPIVLRKYPIIVKASLIYMLIYFFFSTSQSFINRFATLFFWGYVLSFSIIAIQSSRYKLKTAFVTLVLLFCLIRIHIGYINPIYRYVNVLFETENKSERIRVRQIHYESR